MPLHQILYFVKYPEPGRVKTRLAKTMGDRQAAEIYRKCVEENFRTLHSLSEVGISTAVLFDPPEAEGKVREWLSDPRSSYFPQVGEGLTERLTHAFSKAFESGASKVLAIGSDTLGFEATFVQQAFRALDQYDVVLGPARDGGYYLIGVQKLQSFLFEDIPWSTSLVLKLTLEKIRARGFSCYLLPELEDLDEIQNLRTYQRLAKGGISS